MLLLTADISKLLQTGVALHQANDLAGAEKIYRQILSIDLEHSIVLYLMGTLYLQRGSPARAMEYLDTSIAGDPEYAAAYGRRAAARMEIGQRTEALADFDKALSLDPTLSEVWFNRGNCLRGLGRTGDAIDSYHQAIAINGKFAEAYHNLGSAYRDDEEWEKALAAFAKAVELRPSFPPSFNNRGAVLQELGRTSEAIAAYRQALDLAPNFLEALKNLGLALAETGAVEEAERCCRRVLELAPDRWEAHDDFGKVLQSAGRYEEAAACYRRSLELHPLHAPTLNNLGAALEELQQPDEAVRYYRLAVGADPDYAKGLANLAAALGLRDDVKEARECFHRLANIRNPVLWELRAAALCPTVFDSIQEIDEYLMQLNAAIGKFAETKARLSIAELIETAAYPSFNLPFLGKNDRPIKQRFGDAFDRHFAKEKPKTRNETPRVGFLVTDSHETPFLRNMMAMFPLFTPDAFTPVIICSAAGRQRIEPKIQHPFVEYVVYPPRVDPAVALIRKTGLDLLYHREIGTDAWNYFLAYCRLAPLQCTSYGIQVTSGIPAMDYYVSSDLVEPADAADHYSEQLIRHSTLLVHRQRLRRPETPLGREHFGWSDRDRIYGCPQQLGKFHPDFDPFLAEILRRDPAGRIVITEGTQPAITRRLSDRWQRTMPDVAARIEFVPQQKGVGYSSLLLACDVILDPPHFGGMNVSYDGFSMGKVIVTLPSQFHRGRYTLGCYRMMGIDDGVVSSREEYVDRAVEIANNADCRRESERRILEASDALFGVDRSARELEAFFLEAIAKHRTV